MKVQIGQHTLEVVAPAHNVPKSDGCCSVLLNGTLLYVGFNPRDAWGLFEDLEKALLSVEAQSVESEEALHDW
ncbi:hypothetical protein [Pseudomonas phage PH826]|uniref:Uncharacterized protein n=4 Tax=Nankokuvirus TaxID=1925779 RepID=A0A218L456_9CAUD|nr:hypothetical protein [Pseudomonas aeruginosa]YP_004306703.1 hypothetical protein KPP10_gp104 [Pseudomonas phage KPP10]YP_008858131.1 hypothetical protein X837_gp108 [Pseudomonas phage CHA_P1]YP_009604782.1 hypothetical protein FDH93_gp155 [Pseudomonas phage vB_PaeM_G1]QEM41034.1 hypothetical protein PAPJP_108 [Pseudomonas phage PAP-JP]UKH48033.1 MAG: hypothetical protein [Pseudomonas phage RP4]UVD32778.1 hypothetical protein [Pseudomonas phage PH826]WAB56862.1 hypothetical protein [Pseudo